MVTKFTVDYFLKKFEATYHQQWCVGAFKRGKRFCALGFCGSTEHHRSDEARALADFFYTWQKKLNLPSSRVTDCSDGKIGYYGTWRDYGKTPRRRILKALRAIKEAIQNDA